MSERQIHSWADGDEGGNEKEYAQHRDLGTDPAQTPLDAASVDRSYMLFILDHFLALSS